MGVSDYIGSLEEGKMADIIIWQPEFFAAKPFITFKGGFIAYAMMGDPNACIPPVQPVYMRPMFGGFGKAQSKLSAIFSSKIAVDLNVKEKYGLDRPVLPVRNTRNLGKKNMVRNGTLGKVEIDAESHITKFNGKEVTMKPATELPLAQRYYLF